MCDAANQRQVVGHNTGTIADWFGMQHGAIRARGMQRLDLRFTELDLGAGDYVKVRLLTVGLQRHGAHAQCYGCLRRTVPRAGAASWRACASQGR